MNIYSTGQVAHLLNLKIHQLAYAHATGQVAEPPLRFLGKRVYTEADVRRVAEHFGLKVADNLGEVAAGDEAGRD
jgi:DNA-binding transcriptional MerR regulator